MTRIVAGSAKGRVLTVPKSGTRPTSERVREAMFSRLDHLGYLDGCYVLDLYAGSGALGLEAASRGAAKVVCVEAGSSAVKVIKENIARTKLSVHVAAQKVETYLAASPAYQFDLALLDPPYEVCEADLARVLESLMPWMSTDGLIVVERDKKSPEPLWPAGVVLDDERKWGDTRVWSALCRAQSVE